MDFFRKKNDEHMEIVSGLVKSVNGHDTFYFDKKGNGLTGINRNGQNGFVGKAVVVKQGKKYSLQIHTGKETKMYDIQKPDFAVTKAHTPIRSEELLKQIDAYNQSKAAEAQSKTSIQEAAKQIKKSPPIRKTIIKSLDGFDTEMKPISAWEENGVFAIRQGNSVTRVAHPVLSSENGKHYLEGYGFDGNLVCRIGISPDNAIKFDPLQNGNIAL